MIEDFLLASRNKELEEVGIFINGPFKTDVVFIAEQANNKPNFFADQVPLVVQTLHYKSLKTENCATTNP